MESIHCLIQTKQRIIQFKVMKVPLLIRMLVLGMLGILLRLYRYSKLRPGEVSMLTMIISLFCDSAHAIYEKHTLSLDKVIQSQLQIL